MSEPLDEVKGGCEGGLFSEAVNKTKLLSTITSVSSGWLYIFFSFCLILNKNQFV
jgi:hypothetical protein